jgi:hypothetical protein
MAKIEGYASATSILPGNEISFHLSADPPSSINVSIWRIGSPDLLLKNHSVFTDTQQVRSDAFSSGCKWPDNFKLLVPDDWQSGIYRAEFSHPKINEQPAKIYFVVKSLKHGARSPILFQIAVTTAQAYNPWPAEYPGNSLYQSPSPTRSRKVSFDRPHPGCDYYREVPFARWLDENNLPAEYCTSIDLHADPDFLSGYQLLLSVGHDEYWSYEMRDYVEHFIENGGNVAFFSGNTCWWQIRFEDNNRSMVCYKNAVEDPLSGKDNSRVTVEWHASPVNRPENSLTGVSFRNGAGIWNPCKSSPSEKAYEVRFAQHWVFEGTGLKDRDCFGSAEQIMSYETDAADYIEIDSKPIATGCDGTPPSFVILATVDLKDWRSCGKGGSATMGIFRRTGTVFNAATVDWYRGLASPQSPVSRITYNVVNRLSKPYPTDNWECIGQAPGTTGSCIMAATDFKLFAIADDTLWWRQPIGQNIDWKPVCPAKNIIAIAAGDDNNFGHNTRVFVVTSDGILLCKEAPAQSDTPWQQIGEAPQTRCLAAMDGKLFAVTDKSILLSRSQANNWAEDWQQIGRVDNVSALTGLNGALFALQTDNSLTWWNLDMNKIVWKQIGPADGMTTLAGLSGKLFAVSAVSTAASAREAMLFWRDAIPAVSGRAAIQPTTMPMHNSV